MSSINARRDLVVFGINHAPFARDKLFSFSELSSTALFNNGGQRDSDPNGDPLRCTSVAGTTVREERSVAITLESRDVLTVIADGTFSCALLATGTAGARTLTSRYIVKDSGGAGKTATVTLDFAPALKDDAGYLIAIGSGSGGTPNGSITVEGKIGLGGGCWQGTEAAEWLMLDLAGAMPVVEETQTLDERGINGIISLAFITGIGERTPAAAFMESTAALSNAIGAYVVEEDGTIGQVQVLLADATAVEEYACDAVSTLGAGDTSVLFPVSGGASIDGGATLQLLAQDGASKASALVDTVPVLTADGIAGEQDIVHAVCRLNEDSSHMA